MLLEHGGHSAQVAGTSTKCSWPTPAFWANVCKCVLFEKMSWIPWIYTSKLNASTALASSVKFINFQNLWQCCTWFNTAKTHTIQPCGLAQKRPLFQKQCPRARHEPVATGSLGDPRSCLQNPVKKHFWIHIRMDQKGHS